MAHIADACHTRPGGLLFDVDGTLVDSNDLHAEAWREAFIHFGFDIPLEEVRGQIGKGGDNLIPALLPAEALGRCQKPIESFRAELFQRDYLPRTRPFPHVRALFENIAREGRKIVLASSSKRAEVEYQIEQLGVADLITAATSKDDVEQSKPCPDIFAAALGKLAPLGTADVRVVGDSPYDMQAAGKLGIVPIGFLSGGFSEQELRTNGARHIFDGPEDMLARFDELVEDDLPAG